jgi:tetratricopeptide (TPR) repeat protein
MATQKRLNKNLVAFLTVMAIVVVVSVFALIVRQQSRRDPELLARGARDSRQAGDLDEATRRFLRAWEASDLRGEPNTKYVLEAAACLYEMGELGQWRGLLEKISAKMPDDQSLPTAMLEGLWQAIEITGGGVVWAEFLRDAGEKLVQLDAQSVLAQASIARALWGLTGAENEARADRLAQQAFAQEPHDPRVAATYIVYLQRKAKAELEAALAAGGRPTDMDRINRKFVDDLLAVMGPAIEAHPDNAALATSYAGYLQYEGRRSEAAGKAERATELFKKGGEALAKAIDASRARPSPDLYLALAEHEREQFDRAHKNLTAADAGKFRDEIEQIDSDARRAIELEPAMFGAYTLRADLVRRFAAGPQGEELTHPQRLERTLELLEVAQKRTLTLRSVRAGLTTEERLLMLHAAFDVAMAFDFQAAGDSRSGPPTLTRTEKIVEDARVKYPERPLTAYMQGQIEIAKGDMIAAIGSLQQAHQKAEREQLVQFRGQAYYWLVHARANRLPTDQLALLYAQRSQYGEAVRWADLAVKEFGVLGAVPPAPLIATYAEMLRQVGKALDGLSLIDEYRPKYPDDPTLKSVRVSLLTDLKRTDEAQAELKGITVPGVSAQLWIAQKAVDQSDFARAEQVLRDVLKDEQASDDQFREALQRLVDVLDRSQRRVEARAFVKQMMSDPPRSGLQRLLQRLDLKLEPDDPSKLTPEQRKELDDKLLALIAQTTNPLARAQEYYQFYRERGELDKALPYLEEMCKQMPNELRVVEEEFRVRLFLQQFDRATELLALLSQYDNGVGFDHVGGATYRGDLALAKGNAARAIIEYRQAEQQLQAKSDEVEIRLGQAYLVAGKIPEGLEALNRAALLNPRSFMAQRLLREVYRQKAAGAFGAEKSGYEAEVTEHQANATKLAPDDPEVKAWNEEAAEELDPLTAIARREKDRAANPNDTKNVVRLGELLVDAWRQATGPAKEQWRPKILEAADGFYPDVLFTATGDTQSRLARSAAEFYSLAQRADQGATLLRRLIEQRSGQGRIEAQLLLAMFFEALGNPDAAEREYQQAQRLVREVTTDAEQRRQLDLNVGLTLIRFQQRQRRLDKVAEACRWLLDRLGSNPTQNATLQDVRITLIEALYSAGQFADAEAEIKEYLTQWPDDVSGLSARAQLHLRKNERDLAVQDLDRVLAKSPDNVLALYSRGRVLLERGRYDKAREDLVKAEGLVGREPRLEAEVRRQLASLYTRTHQYDLAASELQTLLDVLEKQDGPLEQKQQLVRQLARLLYAAMHQFDQAQRKISEYMEKHPTEALWPFELGRLFETQGANAEQDAREAKQRGDTTKERERKDAARQSYSSAVTYYQRAAERAGEKDVKDRIAALIARLGALNRAGRGTEVIDAFQKTNFAQMPEQFRAEARARLGLEAAKAQEAANAADAARKLWQQALQDAATQSIALTGDIASDMREAYRTRLSDAEVLLRQTVEAPAANDLASQRLRIVLATHLCLAGNAAGALPLLSEALTKVAKGTPEHLSALLTLAQAQDLSGDKEGALRSYKDILTGYPDNLTALNNLAYTLVDAPPPLYAPTEALKYAERLRGLFEPGENMATMLDTVGWVYFHNNMLDLAAAALEEALSAGGPNAAVCLHLGLVYQKANRMGDARTVLNQGLELARQAGDADMVRKFEDTLGKVK